MSPRDDGSRAMVPAAAQSYPRAVPPPPPDVRTLYEEQFDYVVRSLRRLGASPSEIPDLAHEVFLAVHQKLHTYDPARPLRPWLFGIAFRALSSQRKRKTPELTEAAVAGAAVAPDAEGRLEAREARELVLSALEKIGADRRPVFVMHELDGCPVPEIARALELPLNTAYSRLRVAREEFAAAVHRARPGGQP